MNNSKDGPKFRVEEDASGNVEVPADHLWGAQTERSHRNFPISVERYRRGRPVIRALGILKKSAPPGSPAAPWQRAAQTMGSEIRNRSFRSYDIVAAHLRGRHMLQDLCVGG